MDYFFHDPVTVSQPIESDYDFGRLFEGLSPSQPPETKDFKNNDGGGRSQSDTGLENVNLQSHLDKEKQAWVHATNGVLYYAFPIEILWGIFTGIISLIVIARQRKTSNDSYLAGFTVASVLLLMCGSALKLQEYIRHNNEYQKVYGYIKSANDWLWYSALWVLVVMTLERGLTLIQNRSKNFCSALQASVIIIVIFCVCLISALPEFWEYEAIETFDFISNKTIVMSHLSQTADSPEYKIMYFWYSVTIMVLLPYPIMVVMVIVLSQGMKQSRHSKKRLTQKHSSGTILNRKMSDDIHLTRLYIVLILLYILLSGPLTFLVIVNGITPHWSWSDESLYTGLYPIFEFTFYFYFSIQFLLYLTYYDKFRHSFLRTFCCCCCCGPCKRRKKRDSLRRQTKQNVLYSR